jgi:FAD/FMN-containing dehydrogenase
MSDWRSWGRLRAQPPARVFMPADRAADLTLEGDLPMLPFGRGRSYGDVCLNGGGLLLHTARLDRWIDFDRHGGVLRCESGVTLRDILELVVPQGWFLPVTPGTRDVSVGGAIANDVHGKNHHAAGTFGHHLRAFELLRSSGERLLCSPECNADWFAATVGGLGLTGLVTWAELQLIPVRNAYLSVETHRFGALEAFWEVNAQFESQWPYTVAWIDCIAQGPAQGRGVYMAARHAAAQSHLPPWVERRRAVPFAPPLSLVNALSLRAFNTLYWHRAREGRELVHHVPYFYPLDAVAHWNRIYGRRGFYQYQCVVPPDGMREAVAELLRRIARSGQGSFLAVLKTFGDRPSVGMLSFARPGATLALDFPNRGQATLRLFDELDAVVREAAGALYPAKDARMSASMFAAGYPQAERFARFTDPAFSSDFWRRVRA